MNPFEYIDSRKEDFKINCTKDNGFSESDAEDFLVKIHDYIGRFKEVRSSDSLTNEIVDELIEKCESHVWTGTTFVSNLYLFLTHWIIKSLELDKSYYYAKRSLVPVYYRMSHIKAYDFENELKSLDELHELLKAENEKKKNLEKYKTDDGFLLKLHHACNKNRILECTYLQFLTATANGNFSDIDFSFKTRGQYLVFQMKKIMGNDWYEDTIKSKGWKKDDCNRHGNIHDSKGWSDEVHQFIANYIKPQ